MRGYIPREISNKILKRLKEMPAVALLGPRQCGKSTLAKFLLNSIDETIYLDLERSSDRMKLQDAESFFNANSNALICLDEIQRVPEIFPLLRSIIDERGKNTQFLILGSASRDLIKQSSETLAGRIAYLELTPFTIKELMGSDDFDLNGAWVRGGYPKSYLANDSTSSLEWRLDFIRTFLERDIPQLKTGILPERINRLWQMCAHIHAQTVNYSSLASSLGISDNTVRSYLELLSGAFIVRLLPPFYKNVKKRLIKSHKVFIRDSGLLHALLNIETFNDLLGNPIYGSSWEGFVIENILALLKPNIKASFYRTAKGAEIDLILEKGEKRIAIECKATSSPKVTRGFWNALEDVSPDHAWVIGFIDKPYPVKSKVTITSFQNFLNDKRISDFLM